MVIRSRAPLRVSFSGGGTDIPPYTDLYGGVVLSCTIRKYAYCSLVPRVEKGIAVGCIPRPEIGNGQGRESLTNGDAELANAAAKRLGMVDGLQIQVSSDCPPGSGMGSSSALVVAVIGSLLAGLSRPIDKAEVAKLAYQVERTDVGIPGGMQDQYAAAIGGFNLMEFGKDEVKVTRLPISKDVSHELEYRLLLCPTGLTRHSGGILERQIRSYRSGTPEVLEALHKIKKLTFEFEKTLASGDLEAFGSLLATEWQLKKKLDSAVSNPKVDKLYNLALQNGALGGKLLGAGGGGYLLLFAEDATRQRLVTAMTNAGCYPDAIRFESEGLETWKVNGHGLYREEPASQRNHLSESQTGTKHAL